MVWLVDELNEKPFELYKNYQYLGLEEGAKIDDVIAGYTLWYLALLIIRLWTYNDYNINYSVLLFCQQRMKSLLKITKE